jgi:hypothetical protein
MHWQMQGACVYLRCMEQLRWNDYLRLKKIDADAYQRASPEQYAAFEAQFMHMHPESFTAQKLFLINDIRRAHPLLQQPTQQN